MFLNVMNEEEKEKFLELVYKVANIDGNYADEEKEIVNSYMKELNLDEIKETDDINGLINYFASVQKSKSIKMIILFELFGLINADDEVKKEEKNLIKLLKETFNIESEEFEKVKKLTEKLQNVYDEIYEILF